MTAEEAIKILEVAKAECEWNAPLDYQTAFDMAIEALQNSPTQMSGTSALISREEAIDLVYDCEDEFGKDVVFRFADYLRGLPSAQPEIIYCKNCCHYPSEHTDCPLIGWGRNENDFCSKAERRTDEQSGSN